MSGPSECSDQEMGFVVDIFKTILLEHGWISAMFAILIANIYFMLRKQNVESARIISDDSQSKQQQVSSNNRKESCDNDTEDDEDEEVAAIAEDTPHVVYSHTSYEAPEMIRRSRSFYQEMNKRRSVRFFSDKHVAREVIDNLILTAGTSPSGAHTEPWTYVVVSDVGIKQRIREIVEQEEEINYTQRMGNKV